MPFEAALIIAGVILLVTLIGLVTFVANRRRMAQEDEMRHAASSRGWTFTSASERGFRIHRWTGSTEGVTWTAKSLVTASGGNRRTRRHIGRWQGGWTSGPAAPILLMGMPKGGKVPAFSVSQGDGLFAQMAQKAAGYAFDKSVDLYFGEDIGGKVDATVMRRVNANLPGFIVMATDAVEAERFLAQGFEKALVDATNSRNSAFTEKNRPWILLRKDEVSLARMEPFRDINELAAFVHAGVGLTRVPTFGRSSLS